MARPPRAARGPSPEQGRLTGLESPTPPNVVAQIEGTIERIVYENSETGFVVGRLKADAPGLITFVGNLLAVSPGETVRLWGRWVDDAKFGRQLRVERYETVVPSTAHAIEQYLGSGLIKGIGPTYAKRLVAAFGTETLRVIDEQPERLERVPGIGAKRAAQIREAWAGQRAIQSIMLFLQGHGIGVGQATRIYKAYGGKAATVLRENPYRLAEDIAGIAFRSADQIAAKLGMAKDAPERAEAGLLHTLQEAAGDGHCFVPEAELFAQTAALLETPADGLDAALETLSRRGKVLREGGEAYLAALHDAETGAVERLKRVCAARPEAVRIDVDRAIAWLEETLEIRLSPGQAEAVSLAARAKVMVITGGPGTGKTTLMRSLIAIFEKKGQRIELAAPTGRAAKRLAEATDREARTIHRLLEFSPKHGGFLRNEANPIDCDLLVVDEASMLDITLFHSLLQAVPVHARLFFVGDVDQLPSVGPGNVLTDLIASERLPVAWLKTVFRQAAESGIISNAHRINRGEAPGFNTTDFFFVERTEPERALETVVDLVASRMPARFGFDPVRDIQVLAPMHRGGAGVARLNTALQAALNPAGTPIARRTLRTGDKVMQLRNNYERDVYNGDIGVVAAVDDLIKEVRVAYDDRHVLYGFEDLDELTLAYATTVHKAQGSEYPAVVLPLLPEHYLMLQRNVLYTAVTRARQLVVIVGAPKALRIAVQNTGAVRRHTRLADRLR